MGQPKLEINQVICGDSAVVMEGFPDSCIDMVCTSPPYDSLREYKGYKFPFEKIAAQLVRTLKPGGVIVWVVNDITLNGSESGTSFRQALHFMSLGLKLHDTMIWAKPHPQPGLWETRYWGAFEYMFVFSKRTPKTFNPLGEPTKSAGQVMKTMGLRRPDGAKQRFTRKIMRVKSMKRLKNVWVVHQAQGGISGHPARFPAELIEKHIYSWSNPGDLVLDPMAGSGTTLFVAKKMGRNYIGIDISSEYVDFSRLNIERYG